MTRKRIIKALEAIIKESEFTMKNTSSNAEYYKKYGIVHALEVTIGLLKE